MRLTEEGGVPAENPLVRREGLDAIWSWGHRKMQGAAIDPATGALWTVEHGPRGDGEPNRPEAGGNHGWPLIG
jgi:glucose/arabinose dehydrogenase